MLETTTQQWDSKRFRLIGVMPVIIFIARLIQYIQVGTPDWIAANCHIANLMLGLLRVGQGMVFQLLGVLACLSGCCDGNGLDC